MLHALAQVLLGVSIVFIVFIAYTNKNTLARYVAFVILAAVGVNMALSGLVGLIRDVDFLSFLVDLLRLIGSAVYIVEIVIILFLMLTKFKTKVSALKIAIVVYVVVRLIVEFGLLN